MSWNYRVMEFEKDGTKWQAIHEVYYTFDDKPKGYTEAPAGITCVIEEDGTPTDESFPATFARMAEALTKPVLTPADFPNADVSAVEIPR